MKGPVPIEPVASVEEQDRDLGGIGGTRSASWKWSKRKNPRPHSPAAPKRRRIWL